MGNIADIERRTHKFTTAHGAVSELWRPDLGLIYFEGRSQGSVNYGQFAPKKSPAEGEFVEYWHAHTMTEGAKALTARRWRIFQIGADKTRKLVKAELTWKIGDHLVCALKAEAKASEVGQPAPDEVNRFQIDIKSGIDGKNLVSARYDEAGGYRPSFSVKMPDGRKLGMNPALFFDSDHRWSVSMDEEPIRRKPEDGGLVGGRLYVLLGESIDLSAHGDGIKVGVIKSDLADSFALVVSEGDSPFLDFVVPSHMDPGRMVDSLKAPYTQTYDLGQRVSYVRKDLAFG